VDRVCDIFASVHPISLRSLKLTEPVSGAGAESSQICAKPPSTNSSMPVT